MEATYPLHTKAGIAGRQAEAGTLKTATREQKHKKGKAPREKQKLSYKETGESGALPLKIEALEEEKQRLLETLNSPAFYVNRDTDEIMQSKSKAWTWPRTLNWSMA